MPDRFNITTAETDREAILIRERDDARHSADARGKGMRMAFVVICLGAVMMAVLLGFYGDLSREIDTLKDGQKNGREERRNQQAERQYLNCFLAQDDFLMAEQAGVDTSELHDICDRYTTLEESVQTENSRAKDGSLPPG
jgi:hypothetical protein